MFSTYASDNTLSKLTGQPTFSGPKVPVFQAPGGLTVQIPQGDLKAEILKLQSQPGLGYLKTVSERKDINWQPIKLAHEQWNYEQEGLTGAGAAMTSLASQAAISLINNQGNVGKTLKEMGSSRVVKSTIAAALTAGVLEKLGGTRFMSGLNTATATLTEKVTYNLINASTRSLISAGVTGENLTDALKMGLLQGLVDTAHGEVASKIKVLEGDYIVHKLAHALAGCAAGAAAGGACKDGAIGAAVAEMTAELFANQKPASTATLDEITAYNKKVTGYSQLAAGAVTALAGGNAQTAINTAGVAVQNNYLSKPQLQAELNTCKQNNCTESQTDAILKKYVTLSAQNDTALAACTTVSCVDQHSKALQEAATYSAEVMWLVGNAKGNQSLISELQGRQNKGTSLIYAYGKAQAVSQARKEMDQYVQNNCKGLSVQACSTQLKSSQETGRVFAEILVGFTPAGIALDIRDFLQANTMSEYGLAVLGIILPGIGDGVKAVLKGEKAAANTIQAGKTLESAAQTLNQQQARNAELLALFDKANPSNSLKLGGKEVQAFGPPLSNKIGTTKTMDTTAFSDADLQKEVFQYAQELLGAVKLTASSKSGVWSAKLDNVTIVNVRNFSSSGVGRWTIDIKNIESIKNVTGLTGLEVKFK